MSGSWNSFRQRDVERAFVCLHLYVRYRNRHQIKTIRTHNLRSRAFFLCDWHCWYDMPHDFWTKFSFFWARCCSSSYVSEFLLSSQMSSLCVLRRPLALIASHTWITYSILLCGLFCVFDLWQQMMSLIWTIDTFSVRLLFRGIRMAHIRNARTIYDNCGLNRWFCCHVRTFLSRNIPHGIKKRMNSRTLVNCVQ